MKNQDVVSFLQKQKNHFFLHLDVLNNSLNTKKVYKKTIDEFVGFVESENLLDELKILDLNKYFILRFFEKLKNKGLSKNSIILHLKVIKHFFRFISENSEFDLIKPIEKLTIKEDKKEIVTFTKDEIDKIKEYLFDFLDKGSNYDRYKNALSLAFIVVTGIRANECLNIKEKNVDIINNEFIRVKIEGKGNKERYVYLDEVFIEYINKLKRLKPTKSDYLFSKRDGNRLSYSTLFVYNNNLLKKLNIDKSGLHIYRHTLASTLVEENINLETIKEILGHSNIAITSKYYAKASEKAKREAMLRINKMVN